MYTIQQATSIDTSEIAQFLEHAAYVHRHLDWAPLFDWIETEPFLLLLHDDRLAGILVCPPDPGQTAWVKCFACSKREDPENAFNLLINEAKARLSGKARDIFALGFHDWFRKCLAQNSFARFQEVVVLILAQSKFRPGKMGEASIRPMELTDLEEVARVDESSFETQWSLSARELQAAFFQAAHASVAEHGKRIIGYELSTSSHYSAHLARVAVLPAFQQQKIGQQLISEMIAFFQRQGIAEITVNTQSTNHASLQLYRSLGFVLTGDKFPIYRNSLVANTGQ